MLIGPDPLLGTADDLRLAFVEYESSICILAGDTLSKPAEISAYGVDKNSDFRLITTFIGNYGTYDFYRGVPIDGKKVYVYLWGDDDREKILAELQETRQLLGLSTESETKSVETSTVPCRSGRKYKNCCGR